MSRSQRDKGARAEREICNLLREAGYDAKQAVSNEVCRCCLSLPCKSMERVACHLCHKWICECDSPPYRYIAAGESSE